MMKREDIINAVRDYLFGLMFDKYAKYYNQTENKLPVLAELCTIQARLDSLLNDSFSFTPPGEKSINMVTSHYHVILEDEYCMDHLIENFINEIYSDKEHFDENDLQKVKTSFHELKGKVYLHAQRKACLLLTLDIMQRQIPRSVKLYGSMTIPERKELSGAALKNKIEGEKRQKEHQEEIINIAVSVIGKKPLSVFVTESNKAKTGLYKAVARKYPAISEHTIRKWLDSWIKSGDLEKALKT